MGTEGRSPLGHKEEVRPGVWRVAVSCGYRADGTQRRVWRTVRGTARDADVEMARIAGEMGAEPWLGDRMTLDEYYWGRFSPERHATTTRANAASHDSNYRTHISPDLGGLDVGSITNTRIARWVSSLPPQSAPNYVRTLRAVMAQAKFDHVISESPMEGYRFRMPRGRSTAPLPVWGVAEVADALSRPAFRSSQLFALWLVMAGGGLSRSEALALDWEGVAWSEAAGGHWTAVVTIAGACTMRDGMKEPKNDRRYRRVPLAPPFSDALREVASSGPICQSVRHATDGQVPTGHRLSPGYVPKRWKALFAPGAPLEGLPFVPLGRMRATYATMAQAAGLDSTIINRIQGRSPGSQVLEGHYLNPELGTLARAQDAVARGLAGGFVSNI